MIYLILAIIIGILAGTVTGLIPGVHINLIAAILLTILTSSIFLKSISAIILITFLVSMAITHSFLDFIPSIYLGAPDEDSFLSVLPGHKLVKEGRGHEAIIYTLYGSLIALPIILITTPIFIKILPIIFNLIIPALPYLLIFLSLYLAFREEQFFIPLIVFLLSGFLGYLTLNMPIKEPLLPLLTGLFGLSSLLVSIKNKSQIPKQILQPLRKIKLPKKFIKTSLAALASAPFCSFLPGIGSGHAAVISSELIEQDNKSFLFLVGTINTIVIALTFITLYTIGKTRSGIADAIKQITPTLTQLDLTIILSAIIISGLISFILGVQISKIFSKLLNKINYKAITIATITLLILINIIFSDIVGILVLITAAALGVFTILSKSKRINLMGCLIVPTIIFYLTN